MPSGSASHPVQRKRDAPLTKVPRQQNFVDPPRVLAGDAEHVLDKVAEGQVLHHHRGDRDGPGGFGAEFHAHDFR